MTHRRSVITENYQLHSADLGPNSLCLFASSVAQDGKNNRKHSFDGILNRLCERIGHHAQLQPQH